MKETLIFALLLIGLFSCTKYPDGPNGSLLTKRSRVTGVWDLKEIVDQNGNIFTNNDDYLVTMKWNKTMKYESSMGTYEGEWELTNDNKSLRLMYNSLSNEFIIRRLKKKELWIQDPSNGQVLKYSNTDK